MQTSESVVRTRVRSVAPIASAWAAALILRLPRTLRPRSPLQCAASILGAGAVTHWLALGQKPERSRARDLISSFAGAAASLLIVLPAISRGAVFKSVGGSLLVGIVLAHVTWGLLAALKSGAFRLGDFRTRMEAVLSEVVPNQVARLAATEATVLRYVFTWRPPPACDEIKAFTYHGGGLLPLIWIVAGLSLIEVLGVHVLVQQWSKPGAFALSAVSELGVLYLVGVANSFRNLPMIVDRDGVVVRLGLLLEHRVEWRHLTEANLMRPVSTKDKAALQATTIMPANVRLCLNQPAKIRRLFKATREVTSINIYLDQPEAFVDEIKVRQLAT